MCVYVNKSAKAFNLLQWSLNRLSNFSIIKQGQSLKGNIALNLQGVFITQGMSRIVLFNCMNIT